MHCCRHTKIKIDQVIFTQRLSTFLVVIALIIGVFLYFRPSLRANKSSLLAPSLALASASPMTVGNVAIWYDASDATTIATTTTSSVVQWSDKSGNGLNLTDTLGTPPLLNTGALNGLNTVKMSSLGQALATSSNVGVSGNADRTLITVQYNNTLNTGTDMTGEAFGIDYDTTVSIEMPFQWYNDNQLTASPGLYSAWNINVAGRSSGSTYGYVNGTQVGRTVTSTINTVPAALSIGTRTPGDGVQRIGQFAEILYYNKALSLNQRQYVEGYLACKWALQNTRAPGMARYLAV